MDKSDSRLRTVTYKSIIVLMTFLVAVIFIDTISTAQSQVFSVILSPMVKNSFLLVLTLTVGAGYILLFRYLNCMEKKGIIISSIVMLAVMLSIYIVLLIYLDPFSSSDAYNVQDYALYMAQTGAHSVTADAPHAEYFGWFPNNYLLTILFSKYMKIWLTVGVTDMYKPLYLLMVINMIITTLILYLTGVRISGLKGGAMVLAFCVGNPLYYLMIFWAYTNTCSIPFTAGVVYFAIRLFYENNRKDRLISSAMLAFCAVVGYYIRATAVIPMIAFVLCFFIELIAKKRKNLHMIQSFGVITLVSVVLAIGISTWNQSYFPNVSDQNIPITHWLMMAAHGDGAHSAEDYAFIKQFETKEEKQKASVEKMKEYYKSYTPIEFVKFLHKKLKVSWCYAEAVDLSSKINQDRKNTKLYSWLIGDKDDLLKAYCYAFRLADLGFVIVAFGILLKKRRMPVYPIFYAVSFLGGICFYSLWEIKSSYGMPFVMFLLLLGAYGVQCIGNMDKEKECLDIKFSVNYKRIALFLIVICSIFVSVRQMCQSVVTHKDWIVHCSGSATKDYMTYDGSISVEQTFFASKPFNKVGVSIKKDEDSQGSVITKLSDETGEEICHKKIDISQINDDKMLYVEMPVIKPQHENEQYLLEIYTEKPLKGKIKIGRRKEFYMGGYNGVLTLDGKEQTEKLYLQVFNQMKQPWCSVKAAMAIGVGICCLAGVIILMWSKKKCNMKRVWG